MGNGMISFYIVGAQRLCGCLHLYALPHSSKTQLIRLRNSGIQSRFLIIPGRLSEPYTYTQTVRRDWKCFWGESHGFRLKRAKHLWIERGNRMWLLLLRFIHGSNRKSCNKSPVTNSQLNTKSNRFQSMYIFICTYVKHRAYHFE